MDTVRIMFPTPPQSAPAILPESPDPVTQPALAPLTQPATAPMTQPAAGFFGVPATHPTGLSGTMPSPFGSPALSTTAPAPPGLPGTMHAQPDPAKEPVTYSVAIWCTILLGVVILGFWGIMVLRRRLRDPADAGPLDPGFSLSELRAMRDRGEITPEEYERTRIHVITKVKASFDKPKRKGPPRLPDAGDGTQGLDD